MPLKCQPVDGNNSLQHRNPDWPQGDDYRPLNELADLEKEKNYE